MHDDGRKPPGSRGSPDEGGDSHNPDISAQAEQDLAREFSEMDGLDLRDYFRFYPDYFRDQLEELYDERQSEQYKFLFDLNRDAPSPLVWLLLNGPTRFLLACEQCMALYKKKYREIRDGKRDRLDADEQKEIIKIKEEIESYFLELNLEDYQSRLQQKISELYTEMTKITDSDVREDVETEYIQPFIYDNEWLFNHHTIKSIEVRVQDFYKDICELTIILQESGLLCTAGTEDEGVRF